MTMEWPTNLPGDVVQKMRELDTAGVSRDYYGAKLFGGTGWFAADAILDVHKQRGWTPQYGGPT
jgi:hypothetical protein